jgi:hypothetical protein
MSLAFVSGRDSSSKFAMDVDGTSGVTFVRPRRKVTKVCSVAKGDFQTGILKSELSPKIALSRS